MLGQPRTTQRWARKVASDEGALRGDIVRLASRFGRYGYRRVTDMLRIEGWGVNHKRVERIWRQEGLKVPERQPKRGRLWLNDGSCIRLRPLYRGHVWSYDFVASRTHDGRALKLLTVLDEHTRECLAIVVARKIRAHDVLEVLADLFVRHPIWLFFLNASRLNIWWSPCCAFQLWTTASGGWALLATLQHRPVADAGSGSSRRLRHHMPDPAVPHLRDRALPPHAPARLLAWHQPDVGHQLAR